MSWFVNPAARTWHAPPLELESRSFHRALPGYVPTPLVELPSLAAELGVDRLLVKEEASRLGLPAFKILGASFAVARLLTVRLGESGALALDDLRERLDGSGLALAAATDGNHGRAVARVAALLGLRSVISVPVGVSTAATKAISAEGATVQLLDMSYDDVVKHVAESADEQTLVVQDTSWPGYTDIPNWIVDGYDTMLAEVDDQLAEIGAEPPDLVVVPAGVGSLAHAVVAHYRRDGHRPAVLVAEPETAASVTAALGAGQVVSVPTGQTIMTGLNCGTVSEVAWPVLRDGLDASVAVTDTEARAAVLELADFGVDAGPCGAATLAAARGVLAIPERRATLGVTEHAVADDDVSGQRSTDGLVVILLSTEARAANPKV